MAESTTKKQFFDSSQPLSSILIRNCAAFLLACASLYVLYHIVSNFTEIIIPFSLAIIISALLHPLVSFLTKHKIPKILAVIIALVLFISLFSFVIFVIISQITSDWTGVQNKILAQTRQIQDWIQNGPLHLQNKDIANYANNLIEYANKNMEKIVQFAQQGLESSVSVLIHFFAGLVFMFFCTIFMLYDGNKIWSAISTLSPRKKRKEVYNAGRIGFGSLVAFIRTTFIVAAIDGLLIFIGLYFILDVPLAAPLALIVFLGAFIPLIGALVSGAIAVLIALITKGIISALLTVVLLIVVIQTEGHVLQPFLLGRAVKLHPLLVLIAIAIGGSLFSVWGAFLAVPIVAVFNSAIKYLNDDVPESVEQAISEIGENEEA